MIKIKEIRCRMDKERQECKPKNKMHFIITKQLTDIIITKSIFLSKKIILCFSSLIFKIL